MHDLSQRLSQLKDAAPGLQSLPKDAIIRALAATAALLSDPNSSWGRKARATLPSSTGLSAEMVDYGLEHAVRGSNVGSLENLQRKMLPSSEQIRAVTGQLCLVIGAGNVFTAAWRAAVEPLLHGYATLLKVSSQDSIFPKLIHEVFMHVAPEIGRAFSIVEFKGGTLHIEQLLFDAADVVVAYGSDDTIASIQQRLPLNTRFIPHGHGVGAAYISSDYLATTRDLEAACGALALDIAAYDQRGCMSPAGVWVDSNGRFGAHDVATMLVTHSMPMLSQALPRGSLDIHAATQELQWRGVAAVQGELTVGFDFSLCHLDETVPWWPTPGYRNVGIWDCKSLDHLSASLVPFGVHLKTLGIAGHADTRRQIASRLSFPLAPRICPIGNMQKPPIDSISDGHSLSHGYSRWLEIT
ncbi:MAG: hypothetical protein H6714_02655 [Myxococcales bacterium]|nr:hypothetical protein [Myxococcales bacterium]